MKLTQITNPVALRRDTTVGTRIFAGDTMIHGDTGWRDITDLYVSTRGETGVLDLRTGAKILIRRTTGDVYFRLLGPATARAADGSIVYLETGWRPEVDTQVAFSNMAVIRHSRYWISLERATPGAALISANRSIVGQWPTMDPWPTTLPGLPA